MIETYQADCLDWLTQRAANSVDLTFTSPPYAGKSGRYIGGIPQKTKHAKEWAEWMLPIVRECVRVTKGYTFIVANGFVKDGAYQPACECLIWKAYCADIVCDRPVIWHKNAPPNRRTYFSNDWEFVMAFRQAGDAPYFDGKAIGTPPKYTSGGHFRQRTSNGKRRRGSEYPQNEVTQPRDVLRVLVGGGHMGHKSATTNEAPYPEKLVEPFVMACCPVGGVVLDPFCGSGTTLAVADRLGRSAIGIDARKDQIELTKSRVLTKEMQSG